MRTNTSCKDQLHMFIVTASTKKVFSEIKAVYSRTWCCFFFSINSLGPGRLLHRLVIQRIVKLLLQSYFKMLTAVVSLTHGDFLAFFRPGKSKNFVTFFFFRPEELIFPHIQKGQHSSRLGMRANYWIEKKLIQ